MAIGQLTIAIAANAAKGVTQLRGFRKEVAGLKKDTAIASTSVKGLTSALTRVAGPLAAAGTAYFSTRAFLTIANDLDATAKVAAKLNVAPVALQGLRHAADQTGVATQTLDNALSKMTIRAAEAATGAGEAVKVLAELGINAKEFSQLSADKQFIKIAGAMGQQTNQADKLRIATKLFEEEGAALVSTLSLGEVGLNKMTGEAAKLMGTFSAAELAKVEAFNDEMDKLSKLVGGIGSEIVINIAPIASDAINMLTEAINYVRNKEGDRTWLGAAGDAIKTGYSYSPLGFITGDTYQKGGAAQLSKLSYFSDSGSAGQLTAAERAAGKAREANAAKFPNGDNIGKLWESASAGAEGTVKKLMDGVAASLNTVGSTINSTVAQTNAAKRRGLGFAAQGLNPLTGLAPLGMSEARRDLMAGPDLKPIGRVSDRINDLVSADSSEGYQALRANQRTSRLNPADKAAPKIEQNTLRAAKAMEAFTTWAKSQKPRSAGPA